MKRKHLIIVCSVLGILLLAYGLTFWLSSAPKKVADEFFTYIRGSRYTYAYNLTSPSFQKNTSLEQFVEYSNSLNLKKQTAYNSYFRLPGNKKTTLYGKLKYQEHSFPTSLVLVKMNDNWNIATLKIKADRQNLNIREPSNEDVSILLQDTLSNLVYSVQSGDYSKLHAMFALKLKEVLNIDVLENELSKLKTSLAGHSLETGDEMKVTLSKSFDNSGILELTGTYEDLFEFDFKYVYEDQNWNIVAMSAHDLF